MRWAGPCPSVASTSRQPARCSVAHVGDRARDVAAVALDVARAITTVHAVAARSSAMRSRAAPVARGLAGARRALVKSSGSAASVASTSSANGDSVHQPSPRRPRARGPRRTSRSDAARQVDRASPHRPPRTSTRPRGTPAWSRPGRAPGGAPARGRRPPAALSSGTRSSTGTMRSTSTGASDSMPSTAMPSASLSSMSTAPGSCGDQLGRARAHRVGEQDLAARRRPQAVVGDLQAALVGDGEPADLLDVVAPELDPQRVVLGGREDVEDAAAHRELAARSTMSTRVYAAATSRSATSARSTRSPVLQRDRAPGRRARRPPAAAARAPASRARGSGRRSPVGRPGGRAGGAPRAGGPPCRCAATAARAAASPRTAAPRRRRRAGSSAARRPARRPPGRSR